MAEVDGKEMLDPTPVAIPSGVGRPESLTDTIRRMVRNELSQAAREQNLETFEEATDFDMDDEDGPISPYELTEMQEEALYEPGGMGADVKGSELANRRRTDSADSGRDPRSSPQGQGGAGSPPDKPSGHASGTGQDGVTAAE